jgi:hypothetical protein
VDAVVFAAVAVLLEVVADAVAWGLDAVFSFVLTFDNSVQNIHEK